MTASIVDRTFAFVDLAGFSALTEAHGDRHAVSLLDQFQHVVHRELSRGDELVKSIGDAVMLACPTPQAAIILLERLWRGCAAEADFPLPRAGAHHGAAVTKGADYLGAAVNLAARVAGHAGGGEFIATRAVADAARARGLEVADLGERKLRNLAEPVRLFEILLPDIELNEAIDPVCRMRVLPERSAGTLLHQGDRFWFCSLACAARFAADPTPFHAAEPARR